MGGLVGKNDGSITASYSTGVVTSGSTGGGLVGSNTGSIAVSYATGTVGYHGYIRFPRVGGLAGSNSGNITVSYATGAVKDLGNSDTSLGGLVGKNDSGGTVANSYWDTTTSGLSTGSLGTGKATVELQKPTGYTGIYDNWNLDLDDSDGDSDATTGGDDPWDFGSACEYPVLHMDFNGDSSVDAADIDPQRPVTCTPTEDYDRDDDGLIEIGALAQLNVIRWDLDGNGMVDDRVGEVAYFSVFPDPLVGMGCGTGSGGHADTPGCTGYELTEDLDFDTDGDGTVDADDEFWNDGAGWAPIRNAGPLYAFVATFEGNGHIITHLHINRTTESSVGLFQSVAAGGQIRNVEIREAMVRGSEYVGGLVSLNAGSIVASAATGTVEGVRHVGTLSGSTVGGLVGINRGTIIGSSARITVTGRSYTGGLVGRNYGSEAYMAASHAMGTVTGTGGNIGGLVGENAGGTVRASFATGAVEGVQEVGGLVGTNTGKIAASYATGGVQAGGVHSRDAGGLVGSNRRSVVASYATGVVTGSQHVGGLVGANDGSIAASYATGAVAGATICGRTPGAELQWRHHQQLLLGHPDFGDDQECRRYGQDDRGDADAHRLLGHLHQLETGFGRRQH